MKITYLVLGPFMTNTYIIYDENTMDAVIIDPSFTPENIIRAVAQLKVNVKGIFLTHGHVDHMAGLNKLKGVYKEARVYMNINDKEYLSDPKKNLSDSFSQPTICKAADYWVSYREHIGTYSRRNFFLHGKGKGCFYRRFPFSRIYWTYGLSRWRYKKAFADH